jgi:hypothetical protein
VGSIVSKNRTCFVRSDLWDCFFAAVTLRAVHGRVTLGSYIVDAIDSIEEKK